MAKPNEPENAARNLIAAGTVIKGDIQSDGNIRVDGTVVGTLSSKGKVVVGEPGKIEGEIYCQNANISGELKARITVGELLTLQSTAKLAGEIIAGKLAIEPGAMFSGTCKMGNAPKEIPHEPQREATRKEEQPAEVGA
ncbi:MAG: cell shape determination protein CcmA [Flavobacteriales bacterium]|nr:MAG: cell shape determination protein CcmA [Flavobacteriales bacterium]